jgi:hypothetical protein
MLRLFGSTCVAYSSLLPGLESQRVNSFFAETGNSKIAKLIDGNIGKWKGKFKEQNQQQRKLELKRRKD